MKMGYRSVLRQQFPDSIFYFEAADIITQILDFGVPSQIDVQVSGRHGDKDLQVAQAVAAKLRRVRGAVDVHVQQITNAPEFFVQVDRQRAAELGLTEQQVATDLNVSPEGAASRSARISGPDPAERHSLSDPAQTPEYRNDSITSLTNTPLLISAGTSPGPSALQLLSNVATLKRGSEQTVSSHVNTQPTYDIYAGVQDRDLGGVEADINRIVADQQKQLEAPDHITVRGQIQERDQAFFHIGIGLAVAMVAVYLLMAINYQTWGDPFVVIAALPLAFCGIVTSLFITQTTFSIPSLMGAIMSVGGGVMN